MNITICMVSMTLLISSIYLSIINKDSTKFIKFNNLLNKEQKDIYNKIVNERLYIYIGGMILGIILGLLYYYYNQKTSHKFCKVIGIMIISKLLFYYLFPKRPLMLYSLTNKAQTDAWADIYTEMKSRWIKSLIIGFIGYIILGNVICNIKLN